MSRYIFMIISIGILSVCSSCSNLDDIKSVTVYLVGFPAENMSSEDELNRKIPHKEFDVELFKKLTAETDWKPYIFWKGGSLAIITLEDNTKMRIGISNYGCFFKIDGKYGYYEIYPWEHCELWKLKLRDYDPRN